MVEQSTALDGQSEEKKDLEENQEDTKVITIRAGRLLKIKHILRELRQEALSGYSEELKELKSACNETNALLGELNGTGGQKTS